MTKYNNCLCKLHKSLTITLILVVMSCHLKHFAPFISKIFHDHHFIIVYLDLFFFRQDINEKVLKNVHKEYLKHS